MRKYVVAASAALALLTSGQSSKATTYVPVKIKCPIGGERFSTHAMASNSYFGQRPDGRPYSPTPVPPIPECPGNGFVIFDEELTGAEIASLTALVASPEYQAMRQTETQRYRAWWLMSRIGRDPYAVSGMLLTATWETDEEPVRKARYQTEFVNAAMALKPDASQDSDWFWVRARAANALRELGRFDESLTLLNELDRDGVMPTDSRQLEGARYLLDGLRLLNAERNSVSEPTNMVPPAAAFERCKDPTITASEVKACTSPEAKADLAAAQEASETVKAAMDDAREAAAQEAAKAAKAAAEDAARAAAKEAERLERNARRKK